MLPWYSHLRDTANLNEKETPENVKDIISTLKKRADIQLRDAKIPQIRRASAELNGIYGVYQEDLSQGREDYHFLIASDTIQGKTTAQIVEDFLRKQGLTNTSIYSPSGLSTASIAVPIQMRYNIISRGVGARHCRAPTGVRH